MQSISGTLTSLSNELVGAVQVAGDSVVRIDDGTRLTASGSIWSTEGVIVATSHGVEADEGLTVETGDGKTYDATVVGRDPESDIAVLKANGTGIKAFQHVTETTPVGSLVLAIGRPGHAGLQATLGIVGSVTHEGTILHTDAVLYPGFSGGALIDTRGRFAGLLNLGFGRGRGGVVAVSSVSKVVGSLLSHGSVPRGYLGVGSQPVSLGDALQRSLGRAQSAGLLIVSVEPDSPADRSGIFVGDVIVALDGSHVEDPRQLRRTLGERSAGEQVGLEILRGGQLIRIGAILGGRG
jgi:S1-C subfamily serine protease